MTIVADQNMPSAASVGTAADNVLSASIFGYVAAPYIHTGTARASNATRIQLATTASSTDGAYDPAWIMIIGGTGAGQCRNILQYEGANRYAYVGRDWKTNPDSTSVYAIVNNPGDTHKNEGLAQAGGAATITLNALASAVNDAYQGQMVFIVAGTGADQSRMIIDYNGTTKVATIDGNWVTQPDATSIYVILPFPGFVHGRPAQNSTANVLMRDGVGNKTDSVGVPYSAGDNSILAHLNTAYYHVHGTPFVYPNHADDVTLTAGAGAWNLTGAITEVIPAATLTTADFDLHFINIAAISADSTIQIDIYAGAGGSEVLIGATRATRTGGVVRNAPQRIQIPQQPAGTRISCRLSSSVAGATTCTVSFEGHYYAA